LIKIANLFKTTGSFLNHLKPEDQSLYAVKGENWQFALTNYQPYQNHYASHEAYLDFPVVNIDFNAALQYCEWLTNWYHQQKGRTYQKVVFRLPTEKEWDQAASANGKHEKYAWNGNETTNKKGFDLANWQQGNQAVTAKVQSYYPNALGIYNMSGNVAEMTADGQTLKGGSWFQHVESLAWSAAKAWKGNPLPYAGFRVWMEVIEP
jgi:formylglycine-generating enzyme required for sulfatase activity